jgi:hypothetical protein
MKKRFLVFSSSLAGTSKVWCACTNAAAAGVLCQQPNESESSLDCGRGGELIHSKSWESSVVLGSTPAQDTQERAFANKQTRHPPRDKFLLLTKCHLATQKALCMCMTHGSGLKSSKTQGITARSRQSLGWCFGRDLSPSHQANG